MMKWSAAIESIIDESDTNQIEIHRCKTDLVDQL
jgi:hypothetical protein